MSDLCIKKKVKGFRLKRKNIIQKVKMMHKLSEILIFGRKENILLKAVLKTYYIHLHLGKKMLNHHYL